MLLVDLLKLRTGLIQLDLQELSVLLLNSHVLKSLLHLGLQLLAIQVGLLLRALKFGLKSLNLTDPLLQLVLECCDTVGLHGV